MKKITENQESDTVSREINWEAFGKNVRKYRKRKQLTQEQLAERCGMQSNSISRIEKGTAGTKIAGLLDLADALEVSPDALLQGNFDARNSRYAEQFYGLRDALSDRVTEAIHMFFDVEASRQQVETYEDRHQNTKHLIDPAVNYYKPQKPTADPNLSEKTDRRRKPYERE